MKRRTILFSILLISMLLVSSCARLKACSCKKDKTDVDVFDTFVNCIYSSEEVLAGFNEVNTMKDQDMVVYEKTTNLTLERGTNVKSSVDIKELKLSTSGIEQYDETITSYTTIDNVKYTVVDGITYENEFVIPTYYLTFVMSKEFLQEGYTLEVNENNYKLNAKVIDNKIGSLFLNKSLGNLTNMTVEIVIENSKLISFKANYTTTNGFNATIETTYLYN